LVGAQWLLGVTLNLQTPYITYCIANKNASEKRELATIMQKRNIAKRMNENEMSKVVYVKYFPSEGHVRIYDICDIFRFLRFSVA
jgi:hypothetical protein